MTVCLNYITKVQRFFQINKFQSYYLRVINKY